VLRRIVGQVDALIGNEEDLQKGLGIAGPDVAHKSQLDPDTFFMMIDRVVEQFPNIQLVGTTLREVHSTNRHDWATVLWMKGERYVSPTCHLDVLGRIGGGDGFGAGLIYGLLNGRSPEESLRLGWAHGALLTSYPGDITMAKLDEVEALAKGGTARVQR
jgi:2-dehydro-3-deoxygluconokinase